MSSITEFKREYIKAISEGYAAIFAGAGLSRASGYVDWKGLLRTIASDVGLDIDKETDLVAVAQYYKNEKGGRQHQINQQIINEFTKYAEHNKNLEILARLPISVYWTTNYDELIEDQLKASNRKPDVKSTQDSLANNIYDRDALVYKMHGDVRNPSEAVVTKDDYETFNQKKSLFTTALQGDLISKTFLFIGFSFEDPNLEFILSRIKVLLGENTRTHYCFLKNINEQDYVDGTDFTYAKVKQELKVKDLRRYGIEAVLLDSWEQITDILQEIEYKYKLKYVFISGSAEEYGSWNTESATKFMHLLSRNLVKENYKIVSGFGLGVGSYVINGALEEIMTSKYKHTEEHLCLRPFPQFASGERPLNELWDIYRQEMIGLSGISIFLFGNKKDEHSGVVKANGVFREFEIARAQGKYIIPIGATGYVAKDIFDIIKENISEYTYLQKYLSTLENETNIDKLISTILQIIKNIKEG